MDISLVIPAYNEEESIPHLVEWIERVMVSNSFSYEVLFIDDGSSDNTWGEVVKCSNTNSSVKGVRFSRNYGKAAALYVGFDRAVGDVVITMDADLQDSPDEIPELYRMVKEDGFDLVSGWKRRRHDPLGKTLPSKFFNRTARLVSGIKLHDFNCGLKAYKRSVVKGIEVFGEMHRYIPILAKRAGFKRITEKVVEHRARQYGVSKYGIERMVKGYLDLLSIMFLTRFGKSPMYLFGAMGTFMFLAGGAIVGWLIYEKLSLLAANTVPRDVVDQPLFFIALTAVILGSQLFLAGFLGELINRNSSSRNSYKYVEEIK